MLRALLLIVVGVFALGAILAATGPGDTLTEGEKLADGGRAACKEFISRQLHNPDSADWGLNGGSWLDWPADVDGQTVTVQAGLRATNAMGGKVIGRFTCKVRLDGDMWRAVDLSEA